MKRIVKILIIVAIIGVIGFGIYKFFFDCEKVIAEFDRAFNLEIMDYAKIDSEATVKLLKIEDERCKEEDCDRTGQFVAKLLVLNDRHITYVELGSLSETAKDLEKFKYRIELTDASENDVTVKLTKLED